MKKRIKRLKDERMLVKTFWSEIFLSQTLGNTKTFKKKKKKNEKKKKEKKTVLGVIANYGGSHGEIL